MERKIGEIFKLNSDWYQCVKGECKDCDFSKDTFYCKYLIERDFCKAKSVFKKLEKVGKPYEHYEKFYQCYKLPMETEIRLLPNNCYPIGKDNLVEIEIKQKEDMEEKKTNFVEAIDALCKRYNMSDGVRTDFMSELKEIIKDKDKEYNLKPFNLEAAKSGKPLCTRDGRKARIICFDRRDKFSHIVALITNPDGREIIWGYEDSGACSNDNKNNDLMMLPEKKEGWVNLYHYLNGTSEYVCDYIVFSTKEVAIQCARNNDNYITTVKIEWEE